MRLLRWVNDNEFSLTDDLYKQIPPYAILSHTWGADRDEVTFTDLQNGPDQYHDKPGYRKIKFCGEQARRDGIKHFWVDTCCIDKANHSELSEAITSMYRWYQKAEKCYVYLSDVSAAGAASVDSGQSMGAYDLQSSRWFKRGWTLQELLAPSVVEFFSKEGVKIGDRRTLAGLIHQITNIQLAALHGAAVTQFTIPERWEWTVGRETKKPEDEAYCLLGIFEVSMSLRYGEGRNAFSRLTKKVNRRIEQDRDLDVYTANDTQLFRDAVTFGANYGKSRSLYGLTQSFYQPSGRHSLAIANIPSRGGTPDLRSTRNKNNPLHMYRMLDGSHADDSEDEVDRTTRLMVDSGLSYDHCLDSLTFEQLHDRKKNISKNALGTCAWLLVSSEYRSWMQEGGLFLVRGHPGCGKSTLIKYALTEQSNHGIHSLAISFFFFRSGAHLQNSIEGMFRTLLYQLLSEDKESRPLFHELCCEIFDARVEANGGLSWHRNDLRDIFERLVSDCATRRAVKIFIDAVDECRDEDHEELIQFFHSLRESDEGNFAKIATFMTSRTHPDNQIVSDFRIQLEEKSQNDIRQYIQKKLRLTDETKQARDGIKDLLQTRANGSFLWLVLVMRRIHELSSHGVSLSIIKADILQCPQQLDRLYMDLLKGIRADMSEVGVLFQWVCFAARPLSAEELRIALIIHLTGMRSSIEDYVNETNATFIANEEKLRKRINYLSKGLVDFSTPTQQDGVALIQFYHDSVKEFMVPKGLDIVGRKMEGAHKPLEAADAQLANACLRFLACREIVTAMSSTNTDCLGQHAFFEYARDYWFVHAAKAEKCGMGAAIDWTSSETLCAWIHVNRMKRKNNVVAGSQPIHIAAQYGLVTLMRMLINESRNTDRTLDLKTGTEWEDTPHVPTSLSDPGSEISASIRESDCLAIKQDGIQESRREGQEQLDTYVMRKKFVAMDDNPAREHLMAGKVSSVLGAVMPTSLDVQEESVRVTDTQDLMGSTPLLVAAGAGQLDVVVLLCAEGADIHLQDKRGSTPLHAASRHGHMEVVKYLLEHKAGNNIHIAGEGGATPLHLASRYGHLAVVEYLLLSGGSADIHIASDDGQTPLFAAAVNGHLDILKYLLAAGAQTDIHTTDKKSWTPLNAASAYGHLEVVKHLLAHGAETDMHTTNNHGWTPLNAASSNGYHEVVKCLLAYGAETDIHTTDDNGWTPLNAASSNGHLEVVKQLLAHGAEADMHTAGDSGWTPLNAASSNGHLEVVKCLLAHGAEVDMHTTDDSGWTPLNTASSDGHLEMVKYLLAHGAREDIHTTNDRGWTPLNTAAGHGHLEIVKYLLTQGADTGIHIATCDGRTPLHTASTYGHVEVVKHLLTYEPDMHMHADHKGRTPLYLAATNGHHEVVKLLLAEGADVHARSSDGYTALDLASRYGYLEVIKHLLACGADVNVATGTDDWSSAPLLSASLRGHLEVVKHLVENGADVNIRNSMGQTPLLLSITQSHKEISRCLIHASANLSTTDNFGRTAIDWLKLLKTDRELLQTLCPHPEVMPQVNAARLRTSIVSTSSKIVNRDMQDVSHLFNQLGQYLLVLGHTERAVAAFHQRVIGSETIEKLQHNAQCDRCSTNPITGSRFVCKVCPDVDLCSTCMDSYSTGKPLSYCKNHDFVKISRSNLTNMDEGALRVWLEDIIATFSVCDSQSDLVNSG